MKAKWKFLWVVLTCALVACGGGSRDTDTAADGRKRDVPPACIGNSKACE